MNVERIQFDDRILFLKANQGPSAQADAFTGSEDSSLLIRVSDLLANDLDIDGDTIDVVSVQSLSGGTASLVTIGGVKYVQFVPTANFSGAATFSYTIKDQTGDATKDLTSSATVTVTITGTNDAAVIGTPTVAAVTEDAAVDASGNLVASGSIAISDADAGEAQFKTTVTAAAGTLGSLSLAADGSYTYTVANSAVQDLGAGQTKVESFTIEAVDGTTKVVEFTITGTNDAAVIGTPTVAAVTEDAAVDASGNLVASGSVAISDADAGEAQFKTTVTAAAGTLGSLSLAADGSYTYTVANSAVQDLGAGQTKVESFTIEAVDGTTKVVEFTITGTNDAAVIGTPTVAAVTEDAAVDASGNLVASGSVAISDADAGEAQFKTTVTAAAGTLGSLSLAADGSYTYTVANSAVQDLGAGQTKVESFTIEAVDGTTKVVEFTITGTNDAAVIGTPTVAAVTEDAAVDASGNLVASGSVAISDADAGEAQFKTTVTAAAGTLGSLSLAADGSYTYTVANSAVQDLGAGQTKVESFTIEAVDGTTKVVEFTITGTNDAAVIGTPTVAAVTEDAAVDASGNLVASGSVAISDADAGEAQFKTTVTAAAGTLGSLSLAADGSYTYTVANSAVQDLGAGQTKVESFTIEAVDGTTKVVEFTITGTNDAAVIGTPTVAAVTEDAAVDASGNLVASGSVAISDADAGEAQFKTTVTAAAGTLGSLSLAADGSYTYTVANSAVQDLGAGQTKVESFTIEAVDGTTKVVEFTITGTNDAAVIGTPTVAAVTEDAAVDASGNLVASGSVAISDADAGEAQFKTTVTAAAGTLGSLSLAADGSYTYTVANSAVQDLGAGQTKVESFTIEAVDGTTKVVEFTITGTNDAAVIGTPTVAAVTEDAAVDASGNLVASGSIAISDADAGEAQFKTTVTAAAGTLGSLSLAADGSYTYTVANSAVQDLGAGQTKVESFTIEAVDGTTKVVEFTITGTNDAAVIGTPTVAAVTEDAAVDASGNLVASGSVAISDADAGEAQFKTTVTAAAGTLGSLSLAADGSYTYTVANSAVQDLGAGQTKVESFTIEAVDGTTKVVEFTITGVDDGAQIGAARFSPGPTTGISSVSLVSGTAAGVVGNGFSVGGVFSPDGTRVLFSSDASNLVAGDTNFAQDLFVKDLTTGEVTLVSGTAAGVVGNSSSSGSVFSADGTRVLFGSNASNLVAGDTNFTQDLFVKDLTTGR